MLLASRIPQEAEIYWYLPSWEAFQLLGIEIEDRLPMQTSTNVPREAGGAGPYFNIGNIVARGREDFDAVVNFNNLENLNRRQYSRMRAKFNCPFGTTNVWHEPPVHGRERLKKGLTPLHRNQKPLRLLEQLILASSDPGDVVWEPFGGLCSVAVAAHKTGRRCYSAEVLPQYFELAQKRLSRLTEQPALWQPGLFDSDSQFSDALESQEFQSNDAKSRSRSDLDQGI